MYSNNSEDALNRVFFLAKAGTKTYKVSENINTIFDVEVKVTVETKYKKAKQDYVDLETWVNQQPQALGSLTKSFKHFKGLFLTIDLYMDGEKMESADLHYDIKQNNAGESALSGFMTNEWDTASPLELNTSDKQTATNIIGIICTAAKMAEIAEQEKIKQSKELFANFKF